MRIDFFSPAPRSTTEEERQAAVDASGVLNGSHDELQRIVEQASERFKVPMAAISIIDRDRQWFAARKGLEVDQTPRAYSFCAHAIHRPGEALVVPNASADPRFAGNPLVVNDPHIRFYAGVPLIGRTGYPIGALCVIDAVPREGIDLFELARLAREAEGLINRG
jgi:GAF domain-containing protein